MSERQPGVGGGRRRAAVARAGLARAVITLATVATLGLAIVALAGCTGSPGVQSPTATRASSPSAAAGGATSTAGATPSPGPGAPPAVAPTAGLPTAAELAAARQEVGRLGIRKLAGQLVVARYSGTSGIEAAALVRRLHLGGVITFAGNVPSSRTALVPTLTGMTRRVQAAVKADGRPWPAMISVDQEGGPVARLGAPFTELPGAMAYGAADDSAIATAATRAAGDELRALGFTMVFAPVVDVTTGPSDPTIGIRSPGSNPARAAEVAAAMVRGYNASGVIAVAKHFPGHGSVTTDSHVGLPVQTATRATLRARDWVPFRAAIQAGVPAVMAAHIVTAAIDPNVPATLSHAVLTGVLRGELGHQGLIVTDALEMAAISRRYGAASAAVRAIQAGADVLLMPADPAAAITGLVQAVGTGTLERARLEESAARIVATLRHAAAVPRPPTSVVGAHRTQSRALTAAAVTQLSGTCGRDLVGPSVQVSGGTPTDRARFTAAARAAGLKFGSGASVVLLGGPGYQAGSGVGSAGSGAGDVVVALDTPYGLTRSHAKLATMATFGRTPDSFAALVAVLTGRARAPGRLPVAVGRTPVGHGCPVP